MTSTHSKPFGGLSSYIVIAFLTAFLFVHSTSVLQAQQAQAPFPLEDIQRMQRLRPASPYHLEGGYALLSAWEELAQADTLPPKPSLLQDISVGKVIPIGHKWTIALDGLLYFYGGANPYDGIVASYEVIGAYQPRHGYRWVLRSAQRYALKRHRYQTDNHLLYFYAPRHSGLMVLSAGRTTYGTSHASNEEEFAENYITDLGGINNLNSVERDYMTLRNALYLTSALRLSAEVRYERRLPLEVPNPQRTNSWHGELRLSYDFARYGTSSSRYPTADRLPRGFFAPELGMVYRVHHYLDGQGLGSTQTSTAHQLELNLRMAYAFSPYQRIDWALVGETMLSPQARLEPSDYRYLPMGGIDRRPISATWATGWNMSLRNGSWLWGRINYGGGQMLLTRLPLLRRWGLDEMLHARGLIGTDHKQWLEGGYSMGLGSMARVGVFYGTDLRGGNEWMFRFSVPIIYLLSRASTRY